MFLVENMPLPVYYLYSLREALAVAQKPPHYLSTAPLPHTFGWMLKIHSFKKSTLNAHLISKGNIVINKSHSSCLCGTYILMGGIK